VTFAASPERSDHRPDHEARNVRAEGHAARRRVRADRSQAAEKLHQEPDTEKDQRRDLEEVQIEEQEDGRQHARLRVEDEVGAHHAGDRAAAADHRKKRERMDLGVGER
jgi:hypothetical protein